MRLEMTEDLCIFKYSRTNVINMESRAEIKWKARFAIASQVVCQFSAMWNKNLGFQYWQMNDLPLEEEWLSSEGSVFYKKFCFGSGGTWHKDPPLLSAAWECTAGMAVDSLFVKHPRISPEAFYQGGSICESNCSPAVYPLPAGSCSIKSLLILLDTLHPDEPVQNCSSTTV